VLFRSHDERKELKAKRDELYSQLQAAEAGLSSAGLSLDQINQKKPDWVKLSEQKLQEALRQLTDANDTLALLTGYVKIYAGWSKAADQYLQKNEQYRQARATIDKLNLTGDQLNICLEQDKKKLSKRIEQIEKLKADFPDRASQIDRLVTAFDAYSPFRGRLDDPKDLQRMLKGAGILEYRILPTQGHPEVDMDQMTGYIERLKEKGPGYASDTRYVWSEIENIDDWKRNAFHGVERTVT